MNVSYAGSHSLKLPTNINPNALQFQYYGAPGSQQQVSYLTQLVPNPFVGYIQTGSLAQATTTRAQLFRPYPQYLNLYDFRPADLDRWVFGNAS